jgi:hypothetical protein
MPLEETKSISHTHHNEEVDNKSVNLNFKSYAGLVRNMGTKSTIEVSEFEQSPKENNKSKRRLISQITIGKIITNSNSHILIIEAEELGVQVKRVSL